MSVAPPDRIAIILVNYNGAADTIECVESIREMKKPRGGVVVYVVDNASLDDSLPCLRQWLEAAQSPDAAENVEQGAEIHGSQGDMRLVLLVSPDNRGFAAGCNLGLARAYSNPSVTHFWLLNNDTAVDPDAALQLLDSSMRSADRNISGSTLVYYDNPNIVQAAAGARYVRWMGRSRHVFKMEHLADIVDRRAPAFDYIVGASMFFSRCVLETIGYLPERYFLYVEEVDWCARARDNGIRLDWARGAVVLHKEGRSSGAEARFARLGDDAFYFVSRNNLLYLWDRSRYFVLLSAAYSILQALGYRLRGDRAKIAIAARAIRHFWRLRNQVEPLRLPSRSDVNAQR